MSKHTRDSGHSDTLPKRFFLPVGKITLITYPRRVALVYKREHWGQAPTARCFQIDHRGRISVNNSLGARCKVSGFLPTQWCRTHWSAKGR
jgi:hypothetical protein